MNIEQALAKSVPAAAKLHTARSRNDQVATDLRLFLKHACAVLGGKLLAVQGALLAIAGRERDVLVPGYTHLQRAQPVYFAHHLFAYLEMFQRDRAGGPLHRGNERELADQCTWASDDRGTTAVFNAKGAALDDKAGIGIIACIEERVAARDIALLGADRQHAQGCRPQHPKCRDTLQQGNIILDRHEKPDAR